MGVVVGLVGPGAGEGDIPFGGPAGQGVIDELPAAAELPFRSENEPGRASSGGALCCLSNGASNQAVTRCRSEAAIRLLVDAGFRKLSGKPSKLQLRFGAVSLVCGLVRIRLGPASFWLHAPASLRRKPKIRSATVVSSVLSLLLTALAVTSAGISPGAASSSSSNFTGGAEKAEYARYIVEYAAGTDAAAGAEALRSSNVAVGRTFSESLHGAVITATPAQADALKRSEQVDAVEIDAPLRLSDTQQQAPWGLDRIDQRSLPLSGSYSPVASGAGVIAYVIDSGVLPGHAEFAGRVREGWTAIADGQGTVDCNGHGTHVAGTIAGQTYGVAKAAVIIPVRVVDCAGSGHTSDLIAGLDWVAANHASGTPAVANMSIGAPPSAMLDAAVQSLINDGITAVVAAGNSSADACNRSPARVPDVITVAASDSSDRQASFSNFGACVDLYAPGVGITSAAIASTTATAVMSGTSMAAPHVAGAAAAQLSLNTQLAPSAVATDLLAKATTGTVLATTSGTPNRLLFSDGASTEAASAITAAAAASPGIGPAAAVMVCGLGAGGCYQLYQGGAIIWSPETGAHLSMGGIRTTWLLNGAENGQLGYPTSKETTGLRNGGVIQYYQGGAIVWSPVSGSQVSMGGIRTTWLLNGAENGQLGYPTSREYPLGAGAVAQDYQGGRIIWTPGQGASVH